MAELPLSTIPDHFTVQYESSFDLALQQMTSKLRGAVAVRQASGERFRLNNLGAGETTDISARGGATVLYDLDSENVSIYPQAAEAANGLDEFDAVYLGSVVLPNSDLVTNQAASISRKIDNTIVDAMTGVRFLGKDGTYSEAFPAGQTIAVTYGSGSANSGLTFEKIANAAYRLDTDEVPETGRYLGIRAKQMEDLVQDILANHATDLSSIRMMPGSRVITEILGFTVLQAQRFLVDSADIASAIAWQKDQVVLGMWSDRKTRIDIRPDLRHLIQVRTTISVGAARRRNEGVVEILCDETVV